MTDDKKVKIDEPVEEDAEYTPRYAELPQDLEHAPLRAYNFGMQSLQSVVLMGQVGNMLLMDRASLAAFRANDLRASAIYAQYATAYEELVTVPSIFESTIAGDC